MADTTLFQFCQKLVLFNEAHDAILLAKRVGEADYNEIYSFICGKMETTDASIVQGIRREIHEEVGSDVQISVYPEVSFNVFFMKQDGHAMILPHYYAVYRGGDIHLNHDEYSQYKWVKLSELDDFEPKVPSIPTAVEKILQIKKTINDSELIEI